MDKIKYLIEKYVSLEENLVKEMIKEGKILDETINPLVRNKILLERMLPLKIQGLLLMDKLNMLHSLQMPNLKSLKEELDINADIYETFLKKECDSLREIIEKITKNASTAEGAVLGEWKQILEIIDSECRLLERLMNSTDDKT